MLGERNPETMAIMLSVAYTYRILGNYKEAEDFYRKFLHYQEQTPGKEDNMTVNTLNDLAIVLTQQMKLDEAYQITTWNLEIRARLSGKDHKDSLDSMNTLTSILRAQNLYDQAEQLNQKALDLCTTKLGVSHPSTLKAFGNRAANLACRKEWKAAEKLNYEVLQDMERVLREYAPDTLESSVLMAVLLYRQGKAAEAEATYQKSVKATGWSLSTDSPILYNTRQVLLHIEERVVDPWDTDR